MKKTIVFLVLLLLFCAACAKRSLEQNEPTTTSRPTESASEELENPSNNFAPGEYRPIYYDLSGHLVYLVGIEVYIEWRDSKLPQSYEDRTECIAVSFVKDFNISKEDFAEANEKLHQSIVARGHKPEEASIYEVYPVDLIYTFDNEKINEFFLWEGSIYAHEAE